MKLRKITLAVILSYGSVSYAEELTTPVVEVASNPIIESVDIDAYSSTSSIITDKQIRDLNAVDIASALRTTPGVQISRFNPVGGYGGDEGGMVAIRGLGSSRPGSEIKTYIDGVPFYMGVWNHPLLDLLPINAMSAISVYKSPQPQINGNNFASIDLTTKTANENGIHGDTRMSAGSFGTFTEQAALYGKQDAWDFMLAEGYAKSNGHRNNADGELKNALGKVGFQIDDHWRAEATFMYVDNYARDPKSANLTANGAPKYSTEAGMLTASLSHHYDNLSGEVKVYVNKGEGIWYNSPSYGPATMYNKFDMDGLKLKEDFSPWQGGHIKVGLDYDHLSGHLKGINPYDSSHTPINAELPDFYITSPYVAMSQDFKINQEWTLVPSAGVRFYEHNVYDSKSAPHAGLSLVSEKATFFANVSRGINYVGLDGPALQSWGTFWANATSWKNLTPQELDHHEIGTKLTPFNGTQIDASFFYDEVNNRYMYNGSAGYAYMTGGYHTKGAELSVKQKVSDNWLAFVSYTYLDPSLDSLPYMPKNSVTLGVNGRVGDFKVAFDAQHQSKMLGLNSSRFDQGGNGNLASPVSSFTVANVRVAYPVPQLGNKGEVFLAVENLFDEKYEYVPGYTMPGISGQIGFIANF
jgi:iron complex outermembrane receptor protein